jgi:hypothetical protein
MRAFPNIRTPAIAIATILAMLLVPACGSLCAAMNHCSTAAVNSNSDACHHGDISAAASDYISLSISSPASCGDQAPVLAVLTSSDEFSQLKSGSQSIVPFAIDSPNRTSALVSPLHESLSADESPQTRQTLPIEALSVLRI